MSPLRGTNVKCKNCPKRHFVTMARLREHVQKYHVRRNNFVQYRSSCVFQTAVAIFDKDRICGEAGGLYLEKAGALLAAQVGHALDSHNSSKFNETTTVILDKDCPRFVETRNLARLSVRRVRDMYYTQSFGECIFWDMMLSGARFSKVKEDAMTRLQSSGNELTSLLPKSAVQLMALVADVFLSPFSFAVEKTLVEECAAHDEFQSISADGTIKPTFTLLGQPNCKVKRAMKEAQATPLDLQNHNVYSV